VARKISSVVLIGGGQAAAQAAQSLRMSGYDGKLSLVGDEPVLPYQRPPLSKAFMKGELAEERLYFKPAVWYEDNKIDTLLSQRVLEIDRSAQRIRLEHGGELPYDALLIATGARPRALPVKGADLAGVHDLRSLSDVERIRPQMISGRKIVIIGAGYIGLEAAAIACQLGLDVTVLEMADRVIARVTSPVVSEFYTRLHQERGVDIRLGARLAGLRGSRGRVTQAVLDTGEHIDADIILVGIGILPNFELAAAAGLECANGILVDEDARTSDPCIFAAGDCTVRPIVQYGRTGRLESVQNAIEQGKLAAAAIMGADRPRVDCPWFWSDQFDVKLQIAGLSTEHDDIVLRGNRSTCKFSVFYFKTGRLIAVDAVNSPADFLASKKLIMDGARPSKIDLADAAVPMRDILNKMTAQG
jgi:3-phenylpropionate/trans-cinnamate dioxygenase ferredoxin reductase subunit